MFIHHIGHICIFLAKDRLDPAGHTCRNGGAGRIVLGIADLGIQLFDLNLQIGHGADDGCQIHGGQNVTGGDRLVPLHLDLGDLHALRDGDGLQIHIRQASGTGNHGADGTGGHLIGKYLALAGCKLLPDPPLEEADTHHSDDRKHQHDGHHRNDDPAPFPLLVFAQCFKQGIVPLQIGH